MGSQSPQDNNKWGTGRVALPYDVYPGQKVTFSTSLTAPGSGDGYGTAFECVDKYEELFNKIF